MKSPSEIDAPLTAEERTHLDSQGEEVERHCAKTHMPCTFDFSASRPLVGETFAAECRTAGYHVVAKSISQISVSRKAP